MLRALASAAALTLPAVCGNAAAQEQPWAYRVGVLRAQQQGNFCSRRDEAMEIAGIFERFGARTGFSALSNAPHCSLRVHSLTPVELLRRVRIAKESGGSYDVNFIHVLVDDGGDAVLVTTRRLIPE